MKQILTALFLVLLATTARAQLQYLQFNAPDAYQGISSTLEEIATNKQISETDRIRQATEVLKTTNLADYDLGNRYFIFARSYKLPISVWRMLFSLHENTGILVQAQKISDFYEAELFFNEYKGTAKCFVHKSEKDCPEPRDAKMYFDVIALANIETILYSASLCDIIKQGASVSEVYNFAYEISKTHKTLFGKRAPRTYMHHDPEFLDAAFLIKNLETCGHRKGYAAYSWKRVIKEGYCTSRVDCEQGSPYYEYYDERGFKD